MKPVIKEASILFPPETDVDASNPEVLNFFGQVQPDQKDRNLQFALGNVNYSNGRLTQRFQAAKMPGILKKFSQNLPASKSKINDEEAPKRSIAVDLTKKRPPKASSKFFQDSPVSIKASSQQLQSKNSSSKRSGDKIPSNLQSSTKKFKDSPKISPKTPSKVLQVSPQKEKSAREIADALTQLISSDEDDDENDGDKEIQESSQTQTQTQSQTQNFDIVEETTQSQMALEKPTKERTPLNQILLPKEVRNKTSSAPPKDPEIAIISEEAEDEDSDDSETDYNTKSYFQRRTPQKTTPVKEKLSKLALQRVVVSSDEENLDPEPRVPKNRPHKKPEAPRSRSNSKGSATKKAIIKMDASLKKRPPAVKASGPQKRITSFFKPCSL